MNLSGKVLRVIFLVLGPGGIVSASPVYNIRDLGTLGGSWSKAWGINNQGQIVGAAYTTGANVEHAA